MTRHYYTPRYPSSPPDYGPTYWQQTPDPDGNFRDHASPEERARKLDDLKEELAFISALPPGKILDIGCGLGHLLSAIPPTWTRHGVEPSEYARSFASRTNEDIQFYASIAEAEQARGGSDHAKNYDVVVLYHVLEHVIDPERLVYDAIGQLRMGGWLIIGTPDFDSPVARLFGNRYRLLHDPTHVSLFSREGLLRLLRDYGIQIERVETPYFQTRHFTKENLLRLLDYQHPEAVSPPAPGNIITVYGRSTV